MIYTSISMVYRRNLQTKPPFLTNNPIIIIYGFWDDNREIFIPTWSRLVAINQGPRYELLPPTTDA